MISFQTRAKQYCSGTRIYRDVCICRLFRAISPEDDRYSALEKNSVTVAMCGEATITNMTQHSLYDVVYMIIIVYGSQLAVADLHTM